MSHKILLLQNSISVKYVKNDLEIKGNLFNKKQINTFIYIYIYVHVTVRF